MVYVPKYAIVKFNGGRGALLCNKCNHIILEDFNPMEVEDRQYLCSTCQPRHRNDPLVCQATFPKHCQAPLCDCDRDGDYSYNQT